jgi:hypothetical protein
MPEDVRDASIEGCVGKDAANWFRAFCKTTHDMVPIEQIEKDPMGAPVSDKGEVRWMTAVGIAGVMATRPESSTALNLYLNRMDPEFGILAWQLGLQRNEQLIGQPGFLEISRKHQAIFAATSTRAEPVAQQIRMSGDETYDYTVVSRLIDDTGFPVNDRHALWESCQGEAMALKYARHRAAEGRWVDVFKNVAHSVTTN